MTTTVGMLLDDVHTRAWDLCAELEDRRAENRYGERGLEVLAVWPRLATAALRVLDAVPLEPAWLDDMGSVRLVLGQVGRGVLEATADNGSAAASLKPDPAVGELALRLGLIADLLVGEKPARTDVDRAALEGLQANVVSIVHAVATVSLPLLQDRDHLQAPRSVLAAVKARTERFAMIPAERRSGRYEDVGAVTSKSLDAAISTWVHATVDILSSRRGVSQAALQVAAGDALILTATAGTVCAAARRLGLVDADRAAVATSALGAAHAAWRRPAAWPETVRLEGVRDPEHVHASRQLRKLVTDNLRQGRDWLPPERMADRFDMGLLLGTMRRGVHGVGNVALAHFQALDTLVRGRGRLWIAASAVTQAAYRGPTTIEAALRHGWVQMPLGEPAGRALHADAKHALDMTTMALAALDRTAASVTTRQSDGGLRWDRARIVAVETTDQPVLFETVRSSPLAGVRNEQRNPIQPGGRPAPGPRR